MVRLVRGKASLKRLLDFLGWGEEDWNRRGKPWQAHRAKPDRNER